MQESAVGTSTQLPKISVLQAGKVVSSTPLETNHKKRLITNLEQNLNEEIDSHRKKLKSIRSREKANNLEFLKFVSFELTVESIVHLNDSEAVWFKKDNEWTNLMTLYAEPQPSKFERR